MHLSLDGTKLIVYRAQSVRVMSDESKYNVLENRVSLPKPDVDNITVLSESLPNEPVLPWHHFDSPWLGPEQDKQAAESGSQEKTGSEVSLGEDTVEQLELELPKSEATLESEATPESEAIPNVSSAEGLVSNDKAEVDAASTNELEGKDTDKQASEPNAELDSSC